MAQPNKQSRPVRVGVYDTIDEAEQAVSQLLTAGFTKDEITVICSDPAKERHFKEFEHQDAAGEHTAEAATTGGAIGATLGGLTALVGVVATGGIGLVAAGAIGAWAGGVVGGLVGAMVTRGFEKEAADFYDQAVVEGRILVAAENHGPRQDEMLAKASGILSRAGAEPLPLREG
jgi:uncharacterized protein YcfJ